MGPMALKGGKLKSNLQFQVSLKVARNLVDSGQYTDPARQSKTPLLSSAITAISHMTTVIFRQPEPWSAC